MTRTYLSIGLSKQILDEQNPKKITERQKPKSQDKNKNAIIIKNANNSFSSRPLIGVYHYSGDRDKTQFPKMLCNYPDDSTGLGFEDNVTEVWIVLYYNDFDDNNAPDIKISTNKQFIDREFRKLHRCQRWKFHAFVTPRNQTEAFACDLLDCAD